jgi:hypothetical protein
VGICLEDSRTVSRLGGWLGRAFHESCGRFVLGHCDGGNAVLFAVWRFMKWTPIVLVWVALFFFAIGLGQMLMFNGQRPRKASVIVGACTYLCMILGYVAYESYEVRAIPADPLFWLLFFLINVPVGMLLGYIAGGLIASHFLLIDKLMSLGVRTKSID